MASCPFVEIKRKNSNIIFRFHDTPRDSMELQFYFDHMLDIYSERKKVRILYDCRALTSFPVTLLPTVSRFMASHAHDSEAYLSCVVFWITSAPIRTVLRMLFALRSPSCPYYICETEGDVRYHFASRVNKTQ